MKIIIYGTGGCVACNRAKEICEMNNTAYDYVEVGKDISNHDLAEKLGFRHTSFPQIFAMSDGFAEYLGAGFTVLENYLESGTKD